MSKSLLILFFFGAFAASTLYAQGEGDDLMSLLDDGPVTDYTTASFKTNRVINGHSVENTAAGVLDMKISHRFTPLRRGVYDIFGLDNASIRIGVDYGITNRLMIGVGRSSFEKIYDGFVKYKILRQSSGARKMPVTLTYLSDIQIKSVKFDDTERENYFSSRIFYTHQLLIGRKFSDRLTLQLMPTIIHRNLVATAADANDVFAMGVAGRVKLTKRTSFNVEYYHVLPNQIVSQPLYQTLSVGFDIETGGHVFQLHFSNSPDMTYKGFITEAPEPWFWMNDEDRLLSGIRFGFNVSRVFTVKKPKGYN
jgi:Membrane bound beta barrel domain (DUF5777)